MTTATKLPRDMFFISVVVLGSLLSGCGSDEVDPEIDCSESAATFAEANLIIQASCATNSGCHGSGSTKGPGELKTYAQIHNARTSIKTAVANGMMPQGGSLSLSQKSTIVCWIENGALNN